MCPTDPYVYKAMYTKKKWHNSYWTVPTRDSGNHAIRPTNIKNYSRKAGWKYKNNK